jgi:hypothetical protein
MNSKIVDQREKLPQSQRQTATHREWVKGLKEGDRVEVPFSLAPEDIKPMTVIKADGGWLRLLPDGFPGRAEHTLLVCAVSGNVRYTGARIVPIGTVIPMSDHDAASPRREKFEESNLERAAQAIEAAMYEQVPGGEVEVVADLQKGSVEIVRLISGAEGSGAGTEAMQLAVALADELRVRLTLTPDGSYYEDVKAAETRLREFYSRFGFRPSDGGTMERPSN